jgi:RNA polymerase sigma-70 factor (ECF subfamily)
MRGDESVTEIPAEWTDEVLWSRVKSGEAEAFNVLMQRYEGRLYAFIYRLLGSRQEAEDVLQDTFLRAYRNRTQWNGRRAKFSTWLYTIAINRSRDLLRKRRRHHLRSLEDVLVEGRNVHDVVPDRGTSPRQSAEQEEIHRKLAEAFEQLPGTLREVLVLSECESLDYREIARVIGCSLGTVKSRAFRARKELRRALAELEPDVELLAQIRVEEVI